MKSKIKVSSPTCVAASDSECGADLLKSSPTPNLDGVLSDVLV